MATRGSNSPLGDFTIFGFTRDLGFIEHRLSVQLGITPRTVQIGSLGQFFYHTSYGEIAESEEAIVLKLGFMRSTAKSALSAQQLLDQKLVNPRAIDIGAFSGNGLVVGLSKIEPAFSVFQTLMGLPQLYYSITSDGILCSDVLRCLVNVIPSIELDESILPQFFLFRMVCGSSTYFQNIYHLMPGQYLKWIDGNTESRLIRSLDVVSEEAQYIRDDFKALSLLSDSFGDVVGDYITQIEKKGNGLVNLLSGGVDSTFLQYFLNSKSQQRPLRSISYAIKVPAFEYEIENAREASHRFQTEHTYVNLTSQDFPGLLTRAINILSQPHTLETEPSFLAITEFVREANWPEKYFFSAIVADSVFGEPETAKLKGLKMIQKIPFAVTWLRWLGQILAPVTARSQSLLKGAEIIANENDPDALVSRANSYRVSEVDWGIVQRCFGNQAIRDALAYRRNLTTQYSRSCHYLDKVQFIQLLTVANETTLHWQQLALAHKMELVCPMIDEDLLKIAFSFHPNMRYIKGFRSKHLLKRLLEQTTNAPVARRRKGSSIAAEDLINWMKVGPLRPLVEDIERPGFMNKVDFEYMIQSPNYFLMSLLSYDIFKKQIRK
jgi:asparagine synthetase B (glutamine-hydrolysing)